jgi:hypothetical protein
LDILSCESQLYIVSYYCSAQDMSNKGWILSRSGLRADLKTAKLSFRMSLDYHRAVICVGSSLS